MEYGKRTKNMTGIIVRLNDRGFGFIRSEQGKEYFFHRSCINGFWEEYTVGKKVIFDNMDKHVKGPRAENVALDMKAEEYLEGQSER
jgi:cold shock protein